MRWNTYPVRIPSLNRLVQYLSVSPVNASILLDARLQAPPLSVRLSNFRWYHTRNITAFIKHSIDLKGFSHMLSAISSTSYLCLSSLSHSLVLQVKLYYAPVGQSDIIVLDPDIDTIMELDGNIKIQV